MAEKVRLDATSFLPITVSPDGRTVTLEFIGAEGATAVVVLPSPVNAHLIADLQNADARARDLFLRIPQQKGGAIRLTPRVPKSLSATREKLSGGIVLIFDQGLPTEMAFLMPRGSEARLAQAILPLLRERPGGLGKAN